MEFELVQVGGHLFSQLVLFAILIDKGIYLQSICTTIKPV